MPRRLLRLHLSAIVVALTTSVAVLARQPIAADSAEKDSTGSLSSLARRAVAAHNDDSSQAIAELRSRGPEGLRAFLEFNRLELNAALKTATESHDREAQAGGASTSGQSNQVFSALDSICQQKDCYASQLYWYTDIEQAKSAARAQGKPILSLRLLGRLDDDLSCANSRLFRITLYANQQVSTLLRERFVLHWQSVRAVPRVTIDFGDGRKIERTLTGNSIHYVLDSEGRLIDALPGIYGPGAFLRALVRSEAVAQTLGSVQTNEERVAGLRRYHESQYVELEKAWLADVKQAGLRVAPSRETPPPSDAGSSPPTAVTAAAAAISKTVMVERPVLRGISPNPRSLDSIGNDAGWSMIAGLHTQDATLDQTTRALMSVKDPSLSGVSLKTAIAALERSVAEDTVRNEYVFHSRIHGWLASGAVNLDVVSLNEKIYAELFLTPGWDPWLGLRPAGAYSGIDGDGIRK